MRPVVILAPVIVGGCGFFFTPEPATAEAVEAAEQAGGQRVDVDVASFAKVHADGVVVVDVRTEGEYADGHVPGAIHVPIDQLTPDHPAVKDLPRDKPVYFVCEVGGRSSRAADLMSSAGFHAVNVMGGTRAWKAAGHATE